MSSTTVATTPHAGRPQWSSGSVIGVIFGSLVALVAGALALAGLAMVVVHLVARDGDGFINSPTRHFASDSYALTVERVELGDMRGGAGDWAVENLDGRVRVRGELLGSPVFVGIAGQQDLDRYLKGVTHDEIRDFGQQHHAALRRSSGAGEPGLPGAQRFWVASARGGGEQTAEWKVTNGRWAAVVMRSDGGRGLDAVIRVGGKVGWLLWVGLVLLAAGSAGFGGGAWLIVLCGRRAQRAGAGGPPAAGGSSTAEALTDAADRVEAAATEPLTRS